MPAAAGSAGGAAASCTRDRRDLGDWDEQADARSVVRHGVQRHRDIEHLRDALHDRKPKPEAGRDPGALIEPVEFLEDDALLGGRDADAGIQDLDRDAVALSAGSRPKRVRSACI